jgi:hypothetical protein
LLLTTSYSKPAVGVCKDFLRYDSLAIDQLVQPVVHAPKTPTTHGSPTTNTLVKFCLFLDLPVCYRTARALPSDLEIPSNGITCWHMPPGVGVEIINYTELKYKHNM